MISSEMAKQIMYLAPKNQELEYVNMNEYKILEDSTKNLGTWNLQTCVAIAISINRGQIRYLSHINVINLMENNKKAYNLLSNSLLELEEKIKGIPNCSLDIKMISSYSYQNKYHSKNEMLIERLVANFAMKEAKSNITYKKGYTVLIEPTGRIKSLTFEKEQAQKKLASLNKPSVKEK